MAISIDETTCLNLREALTLEWLDTNGLGGYASSSILNCHTRRYHGLLVSNLLDPPGRYVLLSKYEDSLVIRESEFFLTLHRYPDVFAPSGHKYLKLFQSDLCPHFVYQIGDTVVHKEIMMPFGKDCVMVRYLCERSGERVLLRLKPFLAFRDFHALSKENFSLQPRTVKEKNGFKIQPYEGMPSLYIQSNKKSTFLPSPVWYRNFVYVVEDERGFDCHEDLFQPGVLEVVLAEGESVIVAASTGECSRIERMWQIEEARRRICYDHASQRAAQLDEADRHEDVTTLLYGARHFLTHQPLSGKTSRPTIIAGYPWFVDWGRDTLIALPGLTFCRGEAEHGIAVLRSIGRYERNGLLPNFFSEHPDGHAYNSVDCALWYFWAVQQMLNYTDDLQTVKKYIWPVLVKIFEGYAGGTDYGIFMNDEGLLHAGDAMTQLTWMDATVHGKPVTPRHGYAVDINALWYNAICFVDELAEKLGKRSYRQTGLIERLHQAFTRAFWMEADAYLGDVVSEGVLHAEVRPNQLLAVSLPFSPLDELQRRGVVERVEKDLLTPFGLRTLSPSNQAYRGRYAGDSVMRDAAYHQGTVWPWWVAHFGEAYLKTAHDRVQARDYLKKNILKPLCGHLHEVGIDSVSEIFDGDPPHRPNGCIAQAWSVAEMIRLYCILNEEGQPCGS